MRANPFILWFKEISISDVGLVGGKTSSLGEMYTELGKYGIKVPNGFAITAHAYRYFLDHSQIKPKIQKELDSLNITDMNKLAETGRKIRDLIRNCEFPEDLREAIIEAYRTLSSTYKEENTDVAVSETAK